MRRPFDTLNVTELNDHVQERLREIESNFGDDHYPDDKPRQITLTISFVPRKSEVQDLDVLIESDVKLPKRKAKLVNAVIRDGKMLIDRPDMEQGPLFRDTEKTAVNE